MRGEIVREIKYKCEWLGSITGSMASAEGVGVEQIKGDLTITQFDKLMLKDVELEDGLLTIYEGEEK